MNLFIRSLSKITLLAGLISKASIAAPCCAAGSLIPTLITGDDRAQVSLSATQDNVIGDAPSSGPAYFRTDDDIERTQTLRLQAAYQVLERIQAGIDVPILKKFRQVGSVEDSAAGIGDIGLSAGYEWLTEKRYSGWQPRGFVFAKVVLPLSRSTFEITSPLASNALGKGFYSFAVGSHLIKNWGPVDATFSIEGHFYLPRTFDSSSGSMKVSPGPGTSFLAAVGYSPLQGPVRLGLSLSPTYEDPKESQGTFSGNTSPQLVWNVSAQASYLWSTAWSTSLTYNDQTLLGPAENVTLSRSITLLAQRRFEL